MKEMTTLKELMIYELQSLQEAESVWSQALTENEASITNMDLKKVFERGSETAYRHSQEIKKLLLILGTKTLTRRNIVANDLVTELRLMQENSAEPEVLDAGLIVTHQCMSHYKIAKYGSVASYALLLEEEKVAKVLRRLLQEEKEEDACLSQLAETTINVKAKASIL